MTPPPPPPALYNDHEPFVAEWLRRLVEAGHLPAGVVDARDVEEVMPDDLRPYAHVHLFAGIGGWPLALRLAGWPDDRPVWSASLPCQPFSVAGRRAGARDERHLWPVVRPLVAECRPATIFGEQVASRAGREWLSAVRADLEALGYAVGAADLCAAGAGAPHIRQRLFWVADDSGAGLEIVSVEQARRERQAAERGGSAGGVADAGHGPQRDAGELSGPAEADEGAAPREGRNGRNGTVAHSGAAFWSRYELVHCRDGTSRRIEPGVFPLAHGVPARVGRLRGYGNAIVPSLAATFVRAVMDDLAPTLAATTEIE